MKLWFVAHKDYALRPINMAFSTLQIGDQEIVSIRSFWRKRDAQKYADVLNGSSGFEHMIVVGMECSQ